MSMSTSTINTRENCIDSADDAGLVAFFDSPLWLLLDIDTDRGGMLNEKVLHIVRERFGIFTQIDTISKSGNQHVYIQLGEPMDFEQRIFWQLALGSDPVRESLTIIQDQGFSTLYETPQEALRAPSLLAGNVSSVELSF